MTRALVLAALLAAAGPNRARADWTTRDTILQLAFESVMFVDWMQTVRFTQHNDPHGIWIESSPLLGERPSRARVNTLLPLGMVLHLGVSLLLPEGWARTTWQAVTLAVECEAVTSNIKLGVGLSLPWD